MLNCNEPDFVDFIDVSKKINFIEMLWVEDGHETHSWSRFLSSLYRKGSQRTEVPPLVGRKARIEWGQRAWQQPP